MQDALGIDRNPYSHCVWHRASGFRDRRGGQRPAQWDKCGYVRAYVHVSQDSRSSLLGTLCVDFGIECGDRDLFISVSEMGYSLERDMLPWHQNFVIRCVLYDFLNYTRDVSRKLYMKGQIKKFL